MVNIPESKEIYGSPMKYIGLAVLGIVMTAGSAALAFRWFGDPAPGSFEQFIGYVGLVFFGLCTVLIVWRVLTSQGPVVTITPDGIRDTRVAAELIPWTAINNISTWTHSGQKIMVLAVDPEVESQLTLTRIAKWTRGANAALGADGLCVTAQGLKNDYDSLLHTAETFAKAAWANH